jgi:short-subunit dehydrogenase
MTPTTMSAYTNNILLVLGSGPGIGNAVAAHFASKRFNRIALLARNETRLLSDAESVRRAAADHNVEVRTWSVDLGKIDALTKVLAKVAAWGTVEMVFFNAARVVGSKFFETPIEEIRYDFEITNIALYEVSRWAYPTLKALAAQDSSAKPMILVTNSGLWIAPMAELFTLSLTKAAQRNLVESLSQIAVKDDIHVALLSPMGMVTPEMKNRNPKNIASKAWDLYAEEKGHWSLETQID